MIEREIQDMVDWLVENYGVDFAIKHCVNKTLYHVGEYHENTEEDKRMDKNLAKARECVEMIWKLEHDKAWNRIEESYREEEMKDRDEFEEYMRKEMEKREGIIRIETAAMGDMVWGSPEIGRASCRERV